MSGRFDPLASVAAISPTLDPMHALPGFETLHIARDRNADLARALVRRGKRQDIDFARRLDACGKFVQREHFRCKSPSCSVCMRETRRWFTSSVSKLIQEWAPMPPHGIVVTLVPPQYCAPLGELPKIKLSALKRTFWRSVDALGLDLPVIGGVDVSFNESGVVRVPGHYQAHFAFVMPGQQFADNDSRKSLSKKIATAFGVEGVPRAVVVQPLNDLVPQVSYLLKSMFARRVSILGRRGKPDTRSYPLKSCHQLEIADWLDGGSLTDRMLLHGVRRQGYDLVVQR